MHHVDCLVLGGGAAGLMWAANVGAKGLSVLLIDHANKVGKKILMSGGGRCNFTNYFIEPHQYISNNPHFCKSALSRYTNYDFIALVEKYALAYHEKTAGQLFCDNKARDILDILLSECEKARVDIRTKTSITSIKKAGVKQVTDSDAADKDVGFVVETSLGTVKARQVVVATGGLSIPTMGATGLGYDIATQFGLQVIQRDPTLVPFTCSGKALDVCHALSGLSLPVSISCNNHSFSESFLFTHRGMSGPAVLQISNYWYLKMPVTVNFLPATSVLDVLTEAKKHSSQRKLVNVLSDVLPKRFAQAWLEYILAEHKSEKYIDKNLADIPNKQLIVIADGFNAWQFTPPGTEGYRTAEVTRGGINTNDVSSKTFEAKNVAGLYFIGEVLDVTGWLGGFNFQWAWSSAYCAAQAIVAKK